MDLGFWEKFYKLPLGKIPWNRTQMDWFKDLVDSGQISGSSALDLGCGVGIKSVYLAQHRFNRVLGIDIIPKAIKYANKNAKKYKVESNIEFIIHDATDLKFLGNEKFDFVLDWANLHGLSIKSRETYVEQISKHIKSGKTKLLLRTFNNKLTNERSFKSDVGGIIYFLNELEIKILFEPYFKIIAQKESEPAFRKEFVFDEYLMVAK